MTVIPTGFEANSKLDASVGSRDDIIQLSLPVNPAYVSAVRLTASSVANRLGFDTDEIEDVKAAVSEACTFIIKKKPANLHDEYLIVFHLNEDHLSIDIKCKFNISLLALEDEMGLMMIKTLMDKFTINEIGGNSVIINMEKNHKALFLD